MKRLFSAAAAFLMTQTVLLPSMYLTASAAPQLPETLLPPGARSYSANSQTPMFPTGTIGACHTDFDADGVSELTAIRIADGGDDSTWLVNVGLYTEPAAGKTVCKQEFSLVQFYCPCMYGFDFRSFYCENDKGRFLVNYVLGSGTECVAVNVMTMNANGLLEEGTTMFNAMYPAWFSVNQSKGKAASNIISLSAENSTELYRMDEKPDYQNYYSLINQGISPYGIKAVADKNWDFSTVSFTGKVIQIADIHIDTSGAPGCQSQYCGHDPTDDFASDGVLVPMTRTYRDIPAGYDAVEMLPAGMIGADRRDLDSDGIPELVTVSLRSGVGSYDYPCSQVMIRLYEANAAGEYACIQEFPLCGLYDFGIIDFKLYHYTANGSHYYISNQTNLANGAAGITGITHVLTLNSSKQLYAETILSDPGATSAVCLQKTDAVAGNDMLHFENPEHTALLYEWDSSEGGSPNISAYYRALNSVLTAYGAEGITPAGTTVNDGWNSVPFRLKEITEPVASLSAERDYSSNDIVISYSGTDPFRDDADEPDWETDFQPELFYRKILENQRPDYANGNEEGFAEGYRFLDINDDGKEELLLGGGSLNHVWAPICAAYTYEPGKRDPVYMDYQYYLFDGGISGCIFSYTEDMGSTLVYNTALDLWPVTVYALYRFSNGSLYPVCAFAVSNESDTVYYTEKADDLAKLGEYNWQSWKRSSQDTQAFEHVNTLMSNTYYLKPDFCSFSDYDAKKAYQAEHPEDEILLSGSYGYDELIGRFREILFAPEYFSSSDFTEGTWFVGQTQFSTLWNSPELSTMYYSMFDLNEDGSPELAAGYRDRSGDFRVVDLYTIYDGHIVHLASAGTNTELHICRNGGVYEFRNRGTSSETERIFVINDGALHQLLSMKRDGQDYYFLNSPETPSEYWLKADKEIYSELQQQCESTDISSPVFSLLDWTPGWVMKGDLNTDAAVTVSDAVLLSRFITEDQTLTEEQTGKICAGGADLDADGLVTVADIAAMFDILTTKFSQAV